MNIIKRIKNHFHKPKDLNELTYEDVQQMKERGRFEISHMSGKGSLDIIETIRNTPKPDLTQLEEESEELKKRILEAKRNGTF